MSRLLDVNLVCRPAWSFQNIWSPEQLTYEKLNLDSRYNLSKQQKECLYYLTKGMTVKQIARTLNLSS